MQESKIVATERLRREGRWEEASAYRDQVRKELRAQGKPREEAAEAAWEAMLEKYPPLPVEQTAVSQEVIAPPLEPTASAQPDEETGLDVLAARTGAKDPDLPRDVLWVYEQLENRKARPEDAPSLGAWSLLKWARNYRNRFFEQLLPKALAVKEEQQQEQGPAAQDSNGLPNPLARQRVTSIAKRSWHRIRHSSGRNRRASARSAGGGFRLVGPH